MIPKLQDLIDGLKSFLKEIGGNNIPPWVFKIIFALASLFLLLKLTAWFLKLWQDEVKPRIHNPEQKKRVSRRQRYASHIASEIERLNRREDWDDYHFAELEAEVEADARRSVFSFIPFRLRTRTGLRREKSLSKAIKKSEDPIIQLEGEPGSGKSVALRHLTIMLSKKASKSRSLKSIIPVYINLKELKRERDEKIDRNLIESFILKTLKRTNDRNIEEFLDREFSLGLEEGTWFFLFDSFDEIPEVLSSTEEDKIIKSYADAISDFLSAFNQCRGVVASRSYRSPGRSQWAQFRIMPLSEKRRDLLINRADLDLVIEVEIKGQLGMASAEIRDLSKNPMLLGLLCIHMKAGNSFPENAHSVLATYLDSRLNRDCDRLRQRFNLEPDETRKIAEKIAFCMAADHGLGLTPSRDLLLQSLEKFGMPVRDIVRFNTQLDGLEYIKLARSDDDATIGGSRPFTFSHRRFQEYFATCVVLREPERVAAKELLTDARWRETAVVMCQTQPLEALSPLLDTSRKMLGEMLDMIPDQIKVKIEIVEKTEIKERDWERNGKEIESTNPYPEGFPWPPLAIHLFSLLQDGFNRRMDDLPDDIRRASGTIILSANKNGGPFDRSWALDIAGIAPPPSLLELLRDAFYSDRPLLKNLAYRQVSRLSEVPEDIINAIRGTLIQMCLNGRLKRDYHSTRAHLTRLASADTFLLSFRLLSLISRFYVILPITALSMPLFMIGSILLRSTVTSFILIVIFTLITILASIFLYIYLTLKMYGKERKSISNLDDVVFLYFRCTPPPLLFLSIAALSNYRIDIGLSLLCAYLLIWTSSSLIAVWSGRYLHTIWWPFMPCIPALIILNNLKYSFYWLKKHFTKRNIRIIAAGLVFTGISLVLLELTKKQIGKFYTDVIVLCIVIFFFGLMLPRGIQLIYAWLSDRLRWYRMRHSLHSLESEDFIDLVCSYCSGRHMLLIIREIRSQGLLIASIDIESMVVRMALAIDRIRQERQLKSTAEGNSLFHDFIEAYHDFADSLRIFKVTTKTIDTGIMLDFWYRQLSQRYEPLFRKWEGDIIDELCQLLDQVRVNRKN